MLAKHQHVIKCFSILGNIRTELYPSPTYHILLYHLFSHLLSVYFILSLPPLFPGSFFFFPLFVFFSVCVYFNICTRKEKYVEDFLSSHKSLCVLNIIEWVCRVLWLFLLSWPVCLQPLPPRLPPLPPTVSATSTITVSFIVIVVIGNVAVHPLFSR